MKVRFLWFDESYRPNRRENDSDSSTSFTLDVLFTLIIDSDSWEYCLCADDEKVEPLHLETFTIVLLDLVELEKCGLCWQKMLGGILY